MSAHQIVSKQRVAAHGEVYTHSREVNAMLELVKHETDRIESTFLEPACGTGNFLVGILSRKLAMVKTRYAKSQLEYERHAVIAVGSLYGIDILADNVAACRERLLHLFDQQYRQLYQSACKPACLTAVRYILGCNILHGDARTLKTAGDDHTPSTSIIFTEWKVVNGSLIKRRDFVFADLVDRASCREMPLFSDLDEQAYIPEPIRDYPPIHFLEIADLKGGE
ncbi:MAG TPA: DNA methyltransferase [Methylophilus sp.]|nr:DNA methyltransferase [Methylophilus sp.]